MKVNPIYTSNIVKKGLEFAADNSALFAAATTLVLSTAIRPLSILATPKTDRENKKVACAKSLASSLTGYLLMFAVSRPFSGAIQKINKQPAKYLTDKTIKTLKDGASSLSQSKAYALATQMFKLGLGMVIAAPKAIITTACIPLALKVFNFTKPKKKKEKPENISFKGNNLVSKGISKAFNNDKFQKFVLKFKDTNFPMHIIAITDLITTGAFAYQTKISKKIPKERKKPLIHNAFISTGLSIVLGYCTDKMLNKPTEKFIRKFAEINKNSPKLDKYIEGIKIAKPILIIGGIYYTVIPVISTFLADRTARNKKNNKV